MNLDLNKIAQLKKLAENNRKYSPWTANATVEDFSKEIVDESNEVLEAFKNNDLENLKEELGDVLFDVFMMLEICEEKHGFGINDSIDNVIEKFKRRKPNTFEEKHIGHVEEKKVWDAEKKKEKEAKSKLQKIPINPTKNSDSKPSLNKLNKIIIHTDGGSRGNPGNAAIGVVIFDEKNNILENFKQKIGVTTNNVAEYSAVIKALDIAKKYTDNEINLFSDSELTVRQLIGQYKVKQDHLLKLFNQAKNNEKNFKKVKYEHVRREHPNQAKADALVNQALDNM